MSWLADSQMHKVGYPTLDAGYSEEDSRDATEAHNGMEITTRITRRRNDLGTFILTLIVINNIQYLLSELRRQPNAKYLYDYENVDMPLSRSRTKIQKEIRPRRESNDKENKKKNNTSFRENGRLRNIKTENHVEEDDAATEDDNKEQIEKPKEDKKDKVKEEPKVNGGHGK